MIDTRSLPESPVRLLDNEGNMKRKLAAVIILSILACATVVYAQWGLFEHRYKYQLSDVLQAQRFVEKNGYWEGYVYDDLAGYVLLSKDWTGNLVGYSGKHMETLIGMDMNGTIAGVKLIFHSEPIVLIGLKEKNYLKFLKQYYGKSIKKEFSIGKGISMDTVTGATVTAVVHNAIILRSARKVASKAGILKVARRQGRSVRQEYKKLTWPELLKAGAVKNLRITTGDLGLAGNEIYLDLYYGVATVPSIGRNVLGETIYRDTMDTLEDGETAIFVFSRGEGSFKGSGFARGGIFDRFNLEQEDNVYMFRDADYRILTQIGVKGAPEIKEAGLFIVRGKDFDPTRPFRFNLVLPYREGGRKEFRSFKSEGTIPDEFLE